MKIENPVALSFLLQDELFLLDEDKVLYTEPKQGVQAEPAPVKPIPLKFLGKNSKQFLIITHYSDFEFINDTHLTALENILKRKELTLDDVAIWNRYSANDVDFTEIKAFFTPQRLLVLGQEAMPANLNGRFILNQAATIDEVKSLYTFSFDEMMSNNDNKRMFWEQMKML